MTISIIVSVLAGMAMGLRFKVLMIVPGFVIAALSTAAIGIAQGEHSWAILSAIALGAVGMQVGYLCGTFACSMREAQVMAASPSTPVPTDTYHSKTGMQIPVHFSDR